MAEATEADLKIPAKSLTRTTRIPPGTLAPQRLRLERQHDVLIRALLARDEVGRPRYVEIVFYAVSELLNPGAARAYQPRVLSSVSTTPELT